MLYTKLILGLLGYPPLWDSLSSELSPQDSKAIPLRYTRVYVVSSEGLNGIA